MYILVKLNPNQGINLGPNFTLTANVGTLVPATATLTQLLAGVLVLAADTATQVTVTSQGVCTNPLVLSVVSSTTTTTTTGPITTTTTTTVPANCTLTAGSVQESYFLYSENRFRFSNAILGTCIAAASPAYFQPGTLLFDPVVKVFQDPQGLVPFPYAYMTDVLLGTPSAIYSYNSTTGVVGSSVSSCL
jgi:hypothetical protein